MEGEIYIISYKLYVTKLHHTHTAP